MKVHLLLKLRRSKLTRNRKGFSSIIGGIFMVLIVITLASSYFVWTLAQNTVYNDAIKQNNQLYSDRLNEKLIATNAIYVPSANSVNVSADLVNGGSISIQVVTLWVVAWNGTQQRFNVTDLRSDNINLNPGVSLPLRNKMVQIQGVAPTDVFSSWLVTARGNTIPLEEEQTVIVAQLAQGIGSIALDFSTFRYFTYETSTRLASYPGGIQSFNVPSRTNIAFGAVLTNLDPSKQTITLNQYSQVWLYFPKAPGQSMVFYIVNVASNGTITTPYSPITIAFGETKLIVFASDVAGGLTRVSISSAVEDLPCALNLLLLGTIGTRDYGQNIPFVSLYAYKP